MLSAKRRVRCGLGRQAVGLARNGSRLKLELVSTAVSSVGCWLWLWLWLRLRLRWLRWVMCRVCVVGAQAQSGSGSRLRRLSSASARTRERERVRSEQQEQKHEPCSQEPGPALTNKETACGLKPCALSALCPVPRAAVRESCAILASKSHLKCIRYCALCHWIV